MSEGNDAAYSRAALRDLFDYTTFTWESYRKCVATLPPDALSVSVPGSGWTALRDVFFHIALAWDGWLRDRLGLSDALDATPESLSSWEDMQALRDKARGWLLRVIDETGDEELHARTLVLDQGPVPMQASVADVVAHLLLHERGHHGDVTTLLAQLGAPAPPSDYLVHLFFRQRREAR
jgi:uncharacterized damage-inducible protein DinB